jgi:hypothetical protein
MSVVNASYFAFPKGKHLRRLSLFPTIGNEVISLNILKNIARKLEFLRACSLAFEKQEHLSFGGGLIS